MNTLPGVLKELHRQFTEEPTKAVAKEILEHYFSYNDATMVQDHLCDLLHGNLTNELLAGTQTAMDRHNLIFFYEYTSMFIHAVFFLYNKPTEK